MRRTIIYIKYGRRAQRLNQLSAEDCVKSARSIWSGKGCRSNLVALCDVGMIQMSLFSCAYNTNRLERLKSHLQLLHDEVRWIMLDNRFDFWTDAAPTSKPGLPDCWINKPNIIITFCFLCWKQRNQRAAYNNVRLIYSAIWQPWSKLQLLGLLW